MILFLCASDSESSHSVILSLDSEWMFVMIRGLGEEGGGGGLFMLWKSGITKKFKTVSLDL